MPISVAGSNVRQGARPVGQRPAGHGFTMLRRCCAHGFISLRRSAEHGFTLVEMMVVIAIVGLASAAVVVAMPDPRGRLTDDAERFAARVRVAQDSAVIEARTVSVWIAPGGYGFDVYRRDGWQPMPERDLRVVQWSSGVRPILAGVMRDRVVFDPTGLADRPLDLRLERDGQVVTIHIGTTGAVRVDG